MREPGIAIPPEDLVRGAFRQFGYDETFTPSANMDAAIVNGLRSVNMEREEDGKAPLIYKDHGNGIRSFTFPAGTKLQQIESKAERNRRDLDRMNDRQAAAWPKPQEVDQ
jgi:hypothetical protein